MAQTFCAALLVELIFAQVFATPRDYDTIFALHGFSVI
jgi:hypothetical protein